ncbi:MAG: hypothetical protein KIT31_39465 [Deltaproteobacteria bacterium]|nr:hypothetical protein [Deltaproteobacteria bacterium]
MAITQFHGHIGPFLDRVQQRGVPVAVAGTCEYTGPITDAEVQARVFAAIRMVIAARMANGTLTFRNLGEGTLGDASAEIFAQTGLAHLGVQLGELAMRFAIDNGPPQREVRTRFGEGSGAHAPAPRPAQSKQDALRDRVLERAKDKVKSALFWYVGFGLIVLAVLGGTFWYLRRTVDKAVSEPSASAKAAAKWDGKSQLTCSNGDVTIEGVTAKLDGTAIKASGDCHLKLVGVDVSAATAVDATGNAQVTVEGGSLAGTKLAVHAVGNAKVKLSKTKVTGKTQKLGSAEIVGP